MKKRLLGILLILTLILTGCEFGSVKSKEKELKMRHVRIEVEKYGTIELELDPFNAPITVENFINLASKGFYDGLTFHRNIKGFMTQGGDPWGDGTGGSDKTIKGEFTANGVNNTIKHERGTISMARSSYSYDSASSQFFIVQNTEKAKHLDGKYAAFGHVTSGMEVVDKILEKTKVENDDGKTLKQNQPVIKKITVLD